MTVPESVDRLMALVPPPARPVAASTEGDFATVEHRLGTMLPSDYRRLILAYGDGVWQGFWYLLNPFSRNKNLNLLDQVSLTDPDFGSLWAEREIRRASSESYPFPIWPEPGGILPWAVTDNGGRLFWLTSGPPSRWSTVYYPSRDSEFETYGLPVGEILWGAISGELPIFSEEFESRLPAQTFEALGGDA